MSEAKELDWKKYEAITKYIYETLGRQSGVKVDRFGSSCKVTGKSGVAHQIDVLTSHSDGIHSYRTAIECKYWKEKINKDIVMKVAEIVADTGINKGVIVSKNGFTPDGFEYARYKNIGLVELREVDGNDSDEEQGTIDIGILEIQTSVSILRPEISNIGIDYVEKVHEKKGEINIYNYTVRLSNGKQVPFTDYTTAFQNELRHQNKLFQSITKRYVITDGSLIDKETNTTAKINGLIITGTLKKIDASSNLKFSLIDQVWLIMKSIFEERIFKITENGLIAEGKK